MGLLNCQKDSPQHSPWSEASRDTDMGGGGIQTLDALSILDVGDGRTPEGGFAGSDLHASDPACISFHHWGVRQCRVDHCDRGTHKQNPRGVDRT